MNLVRFDPWSIANLVHCDLDRFATRHVRYNGGDARVADWVPAVDIVEEKDRFVLRADVPGVDRDDIDVSMDGGVLIVSGERRAESRDVAGSVQRFERASGRFLRRFALPETAAADGITARSANGILEVVIPKLPEVQARRINVEAA
ncbi:MAG: Hsp20/alpha crystallin family protein [Gammaproteobacteria bacterium]|nr:Hsp20/alpha crystallin family protein [Gammaproteobacteria bacterium]MDH3408382.1 Hsp20/alpha crystallin family protein [Gammaproteobacteria bacterium]MDH3552581.1 Hsp20/alpha crystallin family protein [Gammaproteobacteria bacterium]